MLRAKASEEVAINASRNAVLAECAHKEAAVAAKAREDTAVADAESVRPALEAAEKALAAAVGTMAGLIHF